MLCRTTLQVVATCRHGMDAAGASYPNQECMDVMLNGCKPIAFLQRLVTDSDRCIAAASSRMR